MPTVIVRNSRQPAFHCSFDGWPNNEEERQWRQIVARLLRLAVHGRNLVVVTLAPQSWSLGQELPAPRTLHVQGDDYLVNTVTSCSDKTLEGILDSDELYRGLLWMLPEFHEDDRSAIAKVKSVNLSCISGAGSDVEVVVIHDDGRTFDWLRPSHPAEALHDLVRRGAGMFRWTVQNQHEGVE